MSTKDDVLLDREVARMLKKHVAIVNAILM